MAAARRWWRRCYGAGPLHVVALLACFALVGYVLALLGPDELWNPHVWWQSLVVWFGGAVVLHDLVLFPLAALADRVVAGLWRLPKQPGSTRASVNYLRLPAMGSCLLLAIYFPGIVEQGSASFKAATGFEQSAYLGRWLLLTAALFVLSGLTFLTTALWRRRHRLLNRRSRPRPVDGGARPWRS